MKKVLLVFALFALTVSVYSCKEDTSSADAAEDVAELNKQGSGHDEEPDRNSAAKIDEIETVGSGHDEEPDRDS